MRFLSLKIFVLLTVFLTGAFFCWSTVYSATDHEINVNMNVPSSTTGGGDPGGGGGTDNPPTITNIVSSTTYTTALVSWTATDDKAVIGVIFSYSKDQSYGLTGIVVNNSQTSLSGLTTNTPYNFRIQANDGVHPLVSVYGIFQTQPEPLVVDNTSPNISNIVVAVDTTSSTISFTTNEQATAQVDYQRSGQSLQTQTNSTLKTSHGIGLPNLLPNTVYTYWIKATDASLNTTSTASSTFTTPADSVAPPNVSNFDASSSTNSIDLTWSNPSTVIYPDFVGVKVLRKVNLASTNSTDGTLIYTGSGQSTADTNFLYDTLYYYTAFSFDTSNNYSTGVSDSINYEQVTPPVENCTNGINDDLDLLIDCDDPDCFSHVSCQITPPPVENCTNGIDDDLDTLIDCDDPDCASHVSCQIITPPAKVEICGNGLDDDLDGATDCADGDCINFSGCGTGSIGGRQPACNDAIDNDGDKLIDYPTDKGCESLNDNDEYNPQQTNVPSFVKINLVDVKFFTGNGNISIIPVNSIVSGLAGNSLQVVVPKDKLASTPSSTVVRINGSSHNLILDSSQKNYYTTLTFPAVGITQAYLEVDYGSNQFDSVAFKIKSLPFGDVVDKNSNRLSDVKVNLYNKNDQLVSMSSYGQSNPYTTNVNGNYGWMVPNGQYYIVVDKSGYYQRKTAVLAVSNNIINETISLILKPKPLKEIIDPEASLQENIKNVAKNLGQKTSASVSRAVQGTKDAVQTTARVVQEVVDNPVVEKATEKVVAPVTVGIVSIGILPFLSWSNVLPLLRLLFLQPLMLLGWGKRKKWGLVYNSLNKMPVDLAIVRLIDAKTNKLIQSKVTDKMGRYIFITKPGSYRIEIRKVNFVYPSELLIDYEHDGSHTDIYHGEQILVTEDRAVITANIPLDPTGEHKLPTRLLLQKFGRKLQTTIAISGIVITAVSLYISPKWYIAVLLGVHLSLFLLFKRLSMPRKIKSWGIVYDQTNKKPVGRTIARLFNARFNKLISTQITDRKGRYQFLAGDDKYYVTYEHKQYQPKRTDVNLKGEEDDVVDVDVSLEKKG